MTTFDKTAASELLKSAPAPWVQDLDLSVESLTADGAVLRMRFSEKLCRDNGVVCGQALMSFADTAMIIAVASAATLAIGMALSGTLQNFAGGVMILLFKPYKVGDFIEAQGYSGTVKEIQIFNTILNTPDNKTIIIPNGGLSTGSLNNYSKEGRRRVDWKIGIAYGDDFDTARKAILELLAADKRVFDEPAPFVALSSLADSAIEITVRVWTASENYWGVFFDFNEQVYKQFDKYGLHFPYPQVDVHMIQDNH